MKHGVVYCVEVKVEPERVVRSAAVVLCLCRGPKFCGGLESGVSRGIVQGVHLLNIYGEYNTQYSKLNEERCLI